MAWGKWASLLDCNGIISNFNDTLMGCYHSNGNGHITTSVNGESSSSQNFNDSTPIHINWLQYQLHFNLANTMYIHECTPLTPEFSCSTIQIEQSKTLDQVGHPSLRACQNLKASG